MDAYEQEIEKAVRYIEDHLTETIKAEDVAANISISYYHFHRLFFALTGEMLGDYIRSRRLTQAACELLGTDRRILDIALEYGFESQEAFSRSFKASFGTAPAAFRKKGSRPFIATKNSLLERLNHRMKQISITPELVQLSQGKTIMGIRGKTSLKNNQIPALWNHFRNRREQIAEPLHPQESYSICINQAGFDLLDITEESIYEEVVGLEVAENHPVPEGMVMHRIQPGAYVMFKHQGTVCQIKETYDYIWTTWIRHTSYQLDDRDDFEVYSTDFLGQDNPLSVMRIYLPVR